MYEETKYSMVTIFQRMAHSLAHCVCVRSHGPLSYSLEKGRKNEDPGIELGNNHEAGAQ